jgi:hypothetical protein
VYIYAKNEARSHNHCCRGEARITHPAWVCVALFILRAKCMLPIELSSVVCLGLRYFSTLWHKRHDFRKKLLNIKYVFWLSLQILSEMFILRRIQRHYHNLNVCFAVHFFIIQKRFFPTNTQIWFIWHKLAYMFRPSMAIIRALHNKIPRITVCQYK